MFPRRWADYEDDEELPPLPWKSTSSQTPPFNPFSVLDEDFCLGCETGLDSAYCHTCC